MNEQILWLVLLIAFAVIEGVTAGLVSIWFCAGSVVALISAWVGASLPVQIGLFVVVSLIAMALIRPMARKWFQPKLQKTNADRILEQEGVVVQEIDNLRAKGQVKISARYQPGDYPCGRPGPGGPDRGRQSHRVSSGSRTHPVLSLRFFWREKGMVPLWIW